MCSGKGDSISLTKFSSFKFTAPSRGKALSMDFVSLHCYLPLKTESNRNQGYWSITQNGIHLHFRLKGRHWPLQLIWLFFFTRRLPHCEKDVCSSAFIKRLVCIVNNPNQEPKATTSCRLWAEYTLLFESNLTSHFNKSGRTNETFPLLCNTDLLKRNWPNKWLHIPSSIYFHGPQMVISLQANICKAELIRWGKCIYYVNMFCPQKCSVYTNLTSITHRRGWVTNGF